MKKVWTTEMAEYIQEIYKGRFLGEITDLVNKKFNKSLSCSSVKNFLNNHHLHTGYKYKHNYKCMLFTPDQIEWIKENRAGVSLADFTLKFNLQFNSNFKEIQIKEWCNRNHVLSGLDGRFKKGNVSFNKGKKGIHYPGCEKGWFKKGNIPVNHKAVGTEVVTQDGYIQVKVAEPNVWKLKHRIVWEEHNGPLKDDNVVIFLDGNKLNCDIDNLTLATKAELVTLNKKKRIQFDNKELNQAGITLTRIELLLANGDKK